jgi:HK97 gp10 family phage protein
MRLQATATYKPRGDLGRYIQAHITPGVIAAVTASTELVKATAKQMCPVDTGALRESIVSEITETGKTIVGVVGPTAPYAAFLEYGTGIAGASSPGAGEGPYSMTWPGMAARPFMRPAIDENREAVKALFRSQIALGLR